MARPSKPRTKSAKPTAESEAEDARQAASPRIIGGSFRGRKLIYGGDLRTRPMKDRVREAVFNLVGTRCAGKHAIDLFAGTGALGLEAISRGASRATFIEQHFPTAAIINQNAASLGAADKCTVHPGNTFIWGQRKLDLGSDPWLVFCSPPYAFYTERAAEMLGLIGGLVERAPPASVFVVEADETFDFGQLPDEEAWDVRTYPPAIVGVWEKPQLPLPPTPPTPDH